MPPTVDSMVTNMSEIVLQEKSSTGRLLHIMILLYITTLTVCPVEGGSPRVLKIATIILEPYMMIEQSSYNTTSGVRYVGFIADLIRKLSEVVGFRYELYVVPDNNYGYKKSDGTWNGMVQELIDKKAHVAAGPLLDTSQRREVIDFTEPFLNVHATLLMRKPSTGSHTEIRSVKDLLRQSAVRYGTLEKGVIPRAFKTTNDTELKQIWQNMNHFKPSTMTSTNEEGIQLARRENYAFIMQDTIADYIVNQNPCDLIAIDRFLLNRSYALAVPKYSRWYAVINRGLIMLKNGGTLRTLQRKWWVDRSQCVHERPSSRSFSLAATSSGLTHFDNLLWVSLIAITLPWCS